MPANPSSPSRRQAIIQSYTYTLKAATAPGEGSVANTDAATTNGFVSALIAAAIRQQEILDSVGGPLLPRAPYDDRLFVLHGPRGCGKTFFVNYVLSEFGGQFDTNKI